METDEAACVLVSGHFIGMSPLNCLFLCQLIHFGIQHSSTNFITTVHSLLLLLLHVLLVLLLPCSLYRVAPSRATEQATWPARRHPVDNCHHVIKTVLGVTCLHVFPGECNMSIFMWSQFTRFLLNYLQIGQPFLSRHNRLLNIILTLGWLLKFAGISYLKIGKKGGGAPLTPGSEFRQPDIGSKYDVFYGTKFLTLCSGFFFYSHFVAL